ncbi:hypothetical protein ABZP36_033014 [Zizania latifolia]
MFCVSTKFLFLIFGICNMVLYPCCIFRRTMFLKKFFFLLFNLCTCPTPELSCGYFHRSSNSSSQFGDIEFVLWSIIEWFSTRSKLPTLAKLGLKHAFWNTVFASWE